MARAHAYSDGNKRLAWLTCVTFLNLNGSDLGADEGAAADFVLLMVQGEVPLRDIAAWLLDHSVFIQGRP